MSDPEPPSASDAWWALPGPSGFLTAALRHAVTEGICLVGAPPHLPNDLCVALDGRASELFGLDVDCLDLGSPHPVKGDPIARIAAMLHLDDADADLIGILQHSARAGTLLVISGLTEADWSQMVGPLGAWQRGRRGASGSGMLLMPPVSLPEDQIVLEGFPFVAWRERVSRADMLSFVDRAWGSSGPTLIDRVALGMVVELSAWDRGMVELLSRFDADVLLDPVQKLQEIFEPDQGMAPRWSAGGADLWDGSWVVHIAALLAQGDVDGLHNRVWRAQVREVFPFVDTVRQGFRRRYREVLSAALPLTRSFSGRDVVYDTPERLELAEMISILRPHIGAAELELLQSAQILRCNVAHYTPGTAVLIKTVSDLWEDLSDGTDLHAAPSP